LDAALRGDEPGKQLARVDRLARSLSREGVGYADTCGRMLRAGAAMARGQRERALDELNGAIECATGCDLGLHAAVARFRAAQLLDRGVAEARTKIVALGVLNPERMADTILPAPPIDVR